MKYTRIVACLTLASCMLALNACSTTSDANIDNFVCTHKKAITISANATIEAAKAIKDETLREATIAGAQTSLQLVALCPLDPAPAPG